MNQSIKKILTNSNTVVVSFGGRSNKFDGILPFEFLNFLELNYPDISKIFIIDNFHNSYHSGIEGLTTSIDETVLYLKELIKPYKYVYFLGTSAGGYGAILFGSLLNVTSVLAFIPQTKINHEILPMKHIDDKYIDLLPFINNTTKYVLYCNPSNINEKNCHNMYQCTRLNMFENVTVNFIKGLNLPKLKNSGQLLEILNDVIILKS